MVKPLRTSASVLAWTCLVTSTALLLFLLLMSKGWLGDGVGTVFSTTNGDVTFDGWGLTYQGATGSLLLWGQLISVVAALSLSMHGDVRVRRVAMTVLIAWMALLAANAWWVWLASDWAMMAAPVLFTSFGVIAVCAWSGLRWRRPWPAT